MDNNLLDSVVGIAVASVVALAASVGAWVLYQRVGLSGVQQEVRSERGALIQTLKTRIEHVEAENERLTRENELLKHDIEQLRQQVQRLQTDLLSMTFREDRRDERDG